MNFANLMKWTFDIYINHDTENSNLKLTCRHRNFIIIHWHDYQWEFSNYPDETICVVNRMFHIDTVQISFVWQRMEVLVTCLLWLNTPILFVWYCHFHAQYASSCHITADIPKHNCYIRAIKKTHTPKRLFIREVYVVHRLLA